MKSGIIPTEVKNFTNVEPKKLGFNEVSKKSNKGCCDPSKHTVKMFINPPRFSGFCMGTKLGIPVMLRPHA